MFMFVFSVFGFLYFFDFRQAFFHNRFNFKRFSLDRFFLLFCFSRLVSGFQRLSAQFQQRKFRLLLVFFLFL